MNDTSPSNPSISDLIARGEKGFNQIAERHYALAVVGLLFLVLAINGVGTMFIKAYHDMALFPFEPHFRSINYYQNSPFLPLLAHALGLTGDWSYPALCLFLLACGFIGFAFAARRASDGRPDRALLWVAILLAHPVQLILTAWLGMPDCVTFALTGVLLFARSPWLLFTAGWVGGFNHPILFFAGVAVLLLRRTAGERLGWSAMAAAPIGYGLGRWGVDLYNALCDITATSRWQMIRSQSFGDWMAHNLENLPHALYSFYGVLWILVALIVWIGWRLDRRYLSAWLGIQAVFYGITFFTSDTTRVYAMMAWAPMVHAVRHIGTRIDAAGNPSLASDYRRAVLLIAMAGIVFPKHFVWEGALQPNAFTPMVDWLTRLGFRLFL